MHFRAGVRAISVGLPPPLKQLVQAAFWLAVGVGFIFTGNRPLLFW